MGTNQNNKIELLKTLKNRFGNAKKQATEQNEKQNKIKIDFDRFLIKYPDVNLAELFSDKEFLQFVDNRNIGNVPLTIIYASYIEHKKNTGNFGTENSGYKQNEGDFFTKEQVLKMTQAEVAKNYDKIRESMRKW